MVEVWSAPTAAARPITDDRASVRHLTSKRAGCVTTAVKYFVTHDDVKFATWCGPRNKPPRIWEKWGCRDQRVLYVMAG